MSSYESFAWSDACAVAELLSDSDDLPPIEDVKRFYDGCSLKDVLDYEDSNEEQIAAFLALPNGRRASYLRKLSKQGVAKLDAAMFLVAVIQALVRVHNVLDARDRYAQYLQPGLSWRTTAAGVSCFAREAECSANYLWPADVFDHIDVYLGPDDDQT